MQSKFFILSIILLFISIANAQNLAKKSDTEIYNQAKQNIEKYRKADFSIQLDGLKKNDLKTIQIEVKQTSHDFLFGCIIFDLVSKNETPENEAKFKQRFSNLFNFAVFPFYWAAYESEPGKTKQQEIMKVAKWCNENGITTKGHPLVWTHEAGTPRWLSNYSVPESKELLKKRVEKIVSEFKGEIDI